MLTVRYRVLDVRRGERVLDMGCGAGRHTYETLSRGGEAVAVDLDAGLLKEVRDVAVALASERKDGDPPVGSFSCAAADGRRLPFADGCFDKVIVSEVLEHVTDDEHVLTEVARILRPGGRVALSVPRAWPERICWMLSRQYHSNSGGHVRIYRRADLLAKVRRAGFRLTHVHHAHALHSPYWWLKCAVGPDREDHRLVGAYHRFLVWDIERNPRLVRFLERVANPVMGKSVVVYARKGVVDP